jgi:hypothetical protein
MAWRARRSSATWALALVLGVPALAKAQLFPNAPIRIRRQRPPCETEPPYFKTVRQQYYGYFPTCWRRWPEPWECPCPNPEKPTPEMFAESFRRLPLQDRLPSLPDEAIGGPGANDNFGGAGRPPEGAGGRNAVPPLPPSTPELFNTPDAKPDAARPNDDRGALRTPPPAAEMPGAVVEAPSSGPEPAPNAATTALADVPDLEVPADDSAMSDPTANANANAAPVAPPAAGPAMNPPTRPTAPPPPIMAPTARAPQRRGFLSRLFGDRNRRM